MKSAVTRIIIYSLLIVILVSVLAVGLVYDGFAITLGTGNALTNGIHADSCGFDADEIEEIVILWVNGQVDISACDGDRITYETVRAASSPETVYKLSDGRLTIGFSEKSIYFGKVKDKSLSLSLPTGWADGKNIKIEVVSADICLSDLEGLGKVTVEAVSGEIELRNVSANAVAIDTVSGDIGLDGSFGRIEVDSVSAKCTINALNCPTAIEIDTVSGDLSLNLPQDCGFDLNWDSVTKSLNTDLAYLKTDGHYVYLGLLYTCSIDLDSVSSTVWINCSDTPVASETPETTEHTHVWDYGVKTPGKGDNYYYTLTCTICGYQHTTYVVSVTSYTVTCADDTTQDLLWEALKNKYTAEKQVVIRTKAITDADIVLNVYSAKQETLLYTVTEFTAKDDYWEFSFEMPYENVIIELVTVGGA